MPVEVRYHVIREGKEIAVYTTKKEADAHDKMLDIAEELSQYISQAETVHLEDDVMEELCIYLSKNRDHVMRLLKGAKVAAKPSKATTAAPAEPSAALKPESVPPEKSKAPPKSQANPLKPSPASGQKKVAAASKKGRKAARPKR